MISRLAPLYVLLIACACAWAISTWQRAMPPEAPASLPPEPPMPISLEARRDAALTAATLATALSPHAQAPVLLALMGRYPMLGHQEMAAKAYQRMLREMERQR
jgi:hypothetical protein